MANEGKVRRAKTLHVSGRLGEAEALYREALQAQPGDLEALEGLGVLTFGQGRVEEARALLARAVELRPDSNRLRANLAECLRLLGRRDEAHEQVQRAIQLDPGLPQSWNTLGLLAYDQGRYVDSLASYHEAIRLQPRFASAYVNLGCSFLALRQRGPAITALRSALRIAPDNPKALTNLGHALTEADYPDLLDEAETLCRRAVVLAPEMILARENLGNALRRQGRFDEAMASYKSALELDPASVTARRYIGQLLEKLGRYDESARLYEEARQLLPADARLQVDEGALAYAQAQYQVAAQQYEKAIALDATLAEAHLGLGLAHQESGLLDKAEKSLREALRIDPHLAAAWVALARLQADRGALEESCQSARAALDLRPNLGEAYFRLAINLRGALSDADLRAIQGLVRHKYLGDDVRAALHFALGGVFDARSLYSDAAAHFQTANALQASVLAATNSSYDAQRNSRFIDEMAAAFTPEFVRSRRGWGDPDQRPVFVVGLPRTGTTLVEQILASHSQIHGAGELTDASRLFFALPEFVGQPGSDPFQAVKALDPASARAAARWYLDRLAAQAPASATRIVDKMPDNVRFFGLIALLWPDARVILCTRDLRDVALSCWQTSFARNPWTTNWDHMARRFADHERMLAYWRRTQPINWLDVVYEELVKDLERHARRLIAFVGLQWEPTCLQFHTTRRVVRTASQVQVRRPIHGHSVGRWKKYQSWLGPLFQALDRYRISY
jgi:tetratricopeptide (TPR) repeat protein